MQTILINGTFLPKTLSSDDFMTVSLGTNLIVCMYSHRLPVNKMNGITIFVISSTV